MDQQKLEHLVTKIDDFAETLDSEEQAVLASLFAGGDEVSAFSQSEEWQGVSSQISVVWGHLQVPRLGETTPPGQRIGAP